MKTKSKSAPAILAVMAVLALYSGLARAQEPLLSSPPRVEIGDVAPEFELESLDGDRLNPTSLRGKARVVLVFFRGTW